MGLFVSTVSADVYVLELGLKFTHPTVDYELSGQFTGVEISRAESLTTAIRNGSLVWKQISGGSAEVATDYDPEFLLADALGTGSGKDVYELVKVYGTLGNGRVPTWVDSSQRWEALPPGGGGSGVTPPFTFSKDGNCTVGTALRTGVVPSTGNGNSGQPIAGSNTIVKLSATNYNAVGSTTRIQFSRRTSRTAWTDITDAWVDILSGNYTASKTGMAVNIGPDWEVGCYNKSGSTLSNVICVMYLIPQ